MEKIIVCNDVGHWMIGPLGFPMAIDRPKGRVIIVKQIIIIVLWRPFLPGIPRKEEWDIMGEQEE